MDNIILFIFLAIIILLPILPSYIFFKIIPKSGAEVEGSFASLKYKLSGAFAGYFLMFFMLFYLGKPMIKDMDTWQIWQVDGNVQFVGGVGSTLTLKIDVNPPTQEAYNDKIKFKILAYPDQVGKLQFPQISISHANFIPQTIEITPNDSINYKDHLIILKQPIVLPAKKIK